MSGLVKAAVVVLLLSVPLLVITALPRFFELAGSIPATGSQPAAAGAPAFRLVDATPTNARARFGALEETPPPTLAPPAMTATPVATPRPAPTGERVVIGNTGGVGAVLRAEPVTGRAVASLREQLVVDVLERRSMPGNGEWVHVRTAEGVDGWVIGLVALPVSPSDH
jgi:hypothetical protein